MTYKNRQANEGKARANVALIIMYINIEHHILITLLTQNKQTYNRCSAQLRTLMQTSLFFFFFFALKHQ